MRIDDFRIISRAGETLSKGFFLRNNYSDHGLYLDIDCAFMKCVIHRKEFKIKIERIHMYVYVLDRK